MVTSEAISARFPLIVTGDAFIHREDDGRTHLRNRTILDVAVALLAFQLAYSDMPFV